jgi:hypothetical protein
MFATRPGFVDLQANQAIISCGARSFRAANSIEKQQLQQTGIVQLYCYWVGT